MEQILKIIREKNRLISDLIGPALFALAGLIMFVAALNDTADNSLLPSPFYWAFGLFFLGQACAGASAALNKATDRKEHLKSAAA